MVYSLLALIIRLFLAFQFWTKGQGALKSQSRTVENTVMLVSAVSLVLGFFVYLMTLILLIYLGMQIWSNRKNASGPWRFGKTELLFVLTLILFLKGSGQFSLDKLLGNI